MKNLNLAGHEESILKEFDKKFAHRNIKTHEYEDRWFVKDAVTSGEIKSFLSLSLKHQRDMIVAELKKIATWPEPVPSAGKEIGPLFTSGLVTQYKHDKERHEKEVGDIIQSLQQ